MRHIETVHEKRRGHACCYCKDVTFGTASDLERHTSDQPGDQASSIKRNIKGTIG
jgi:hypothetical protein